MSPHVPRKEHAIFYSDTQKLVQKMTSWSMTCTYDGRYHLYTCYKWGSQWCPCRSDCRVCTSSWDGVKCMTVKPFGDSSIKERSLWATTADLSLDAVCFGYETCQCQRSIYCHPSCCTCPTRMPDICLSSFIQKQAKRAETANEKIFNRIFSNNTK